VIYLDASAALAHLLAEEKRPPLALWDEPIASSRLLLYEIWNTLTGRRLVKSHAIAADELFARVELVDPTAEALARAIDPFPVSVRTLDALHLSTIDFLVKQKLDVRLASYDKRMNACAQALGIELYPL
jgi:hypothetical protein